MQDLVLAAKGVQDRLLSTLDAHRGPVRDPVLDQLAREALLALSSDWAFMVSHDSAAGYARDRAAAHAGRVHALADLLDAGDRAGAEALAGPAARRRRPVRPPRRAGLLEDARPS